MINNINKINANIRKKRNKKPKDFLLNGKYPK